MKHNYIMSNQSLVSFIDGERHSCSFGSLRYKSALEAIQNDDDEAFAQAMTGNEIDTLNAKAETQGFSIIGGILKLDGVEIIGSLQTKLTRMLREELPIKGFVNFIRKLRKNPSRSSVKELYDFLSYAELPITEEGNLIAYKGIQDDYYSCTAGSMSLKKGKVDENGRVYNGIGEEIECERVEVDDDRRNQCSNGLHVGSHDYAVGFGSKTVVVEVDPAHVVSVPLDCECQKMRVSGYRVICDYGKEIESATVDSDANEIKSSRKELASKIDKSVCSLKKTGSPVTVKRIQSALSPECPPLHEIRDVLVNDLGYDVFIADPTAKTSVGAMWVE